MCLVKKTEKFMGKGTDSETSRTILPSNYDMFLSRFRFCSISLSETATFKARFNQKLTGDPKNTQKCKYASI